MRRQGCRRRPGRCGGGPDPPESRAARGAAGALSAAGAIGKRSTPACECAGRSHSQCRSRLPGWRSRICSGSGSVPPSDRVTAPRQEIYAARERRCPTLVALHDVADRHARSVAAGGAARLVLARRAHRRPGESRGSALAAACSPRSFCAAYLFYAVFEVWAYLRFLLPALAVAMIAVASLVLAPARAQPALRAPLLIVVALALAASNLRAARQLDVFRLADRHARASLAGRYLDVVLPPNAVVVSGEQSGALRYYTGRSIVRWDLATPEALATRDRAPGRTALRRVDRARRVGRGSSAPQDSRHAGRRARLAARARGRHRTAHARLAPARS